MKSCVVTCSGDGDGQVCVYNIDNIKEAMRITQEDRPIEGQVQVSIEESFSVSM